MAASSADSGGRRAAARPRRMLCPPFPMFRRRDPGLTGNIINLGTIIFILNPEHSAYPVLILIGVYQPGP